MKAVTRVAQMFLAFATLGLFFWWALGLFEKLMDPADPTFCFLGARYQSIRTHWDWPTEKGVRSRREVLIDEIDCACGNGSDAPDICGIFPIQPTSTRELEQLASHYIEIGTSEVTKKCMAKRGYVDVQRKEWLCSPSRWN